MYENEKKAIAVFVTLISPQSIILFRPHQHHHRLAKNSAEFSIVV
ncbi:hypothetical protein [Nostoc sp. FACHB-145]|nr:hypothetical protein [Nostoc sp. FACHB-145]